MKEELRSNWPDFDHLQTSLVSADEAVHRAIWNSSKNGVDGGADGCLTPLPSSVASAGEESKTATVVGTSKLSNRNGESNNG